MLLGGINPIPLSLADLKLVHATCFALFGFWKY